MITLRRDNVVKQTESEVVALALESQGFVREGAAKKSGSGKLKCYTNVVTVVANKI